MVSALQLELMRLLDDAEVDKAVADYCWTT